MDLSEMNILDQSPITWLSRYDDLIRIFRQLKFYSEYRKRLYVDSKRKFNNDIFFNMNVKT